MSELRQYLLATLDRERFAIDIAHVQEVLRQPEITRVPVKNKTLAGVIRLRDQVIPLVNVRHKLYDLPLPAEDTVVLVINEPNLQKRIGLLVDAVSVVLAIPDSEIEHPDLFEGHDAQEVISGIAKLSDGLALVLDPGKLFSPEDQQVLDKAIKSGEKKL